MSDAGTPALQVDDLSIGFDTDDGLVRVVEDVSFTLDKGKTLSLAGESGCGKSLTALAVLQLLPPFGKILSGSIKLHGRELTGLTDEAMQKVRGSDISMIFQEPMSALNPVFTIGRQIGEALLLHKGMNKAHAHKRAIEMLESVGIPDPESRANNYPHQLSGGMRQRVMIAMALACEPDILIADEPETGLDPVLRRVVTELMLQVASDHNVALMMISHNMDTVGRIADHVVRIGGEPQGGPT